MQRIMMAFATLFFLAVSFAQVPSGEQSVKVAGTWDVTIRMSGQKVSETWIIQQDGDNVTVTIKNAKGEARVTGEVNGTIFRTDFKDRDGMPNKVRAGVLDDRMDGSLTIGNKEYLWAAKRPKS